MLTVSITLIILIIISYLSLLFYKVDFNIKSKSFTYLTIFILSFIFLSLKLYIKYNLHEIIKIKCNDLKVINDLKLNDDLKLLGMKKIESYKNDIIILFENSLNTEQAVSLGQLVESEIIKYNLRKVIDIT